MNVDPSKALEIPNKNYLHICKRIAESPDVISRLADTLYFEKFIIWDTQSVVKHTPSLTPYDKATKLLGPAIESNTHRIDRLDRLIRILQGFNVTLQAPQEVTLCALLFSVFFE